MVKGQFGAGILIWLLMAIAGISCMWVIGFALTPLFWIIQIYDAYTSPDAAQKRELDRLKSR